MHNTGMAKKLKVLGQRIKELRTSKNLLQRDLAKMIDVAEYSVGDWERSRAEPDYDNLRKLCVALNVSADELLGLETERDRSSVKINRRIS